MVCLGGIVFLDDIATIDPICIMIHAVSFSVSTRTPGGISITGMDPPIIAKDNSGAKQTIFAPLAAHATSCEQMPLVLLCFTEAEALKLFSTQKLVFLMASLIASTLI